MRKILCSMAVFIAALVAAQHAFALVDDEEQEDRPVVADTDGDGLMDYEEALYGTNPLVADTDGDGLTDYEEVVVYGTDPLRADTDGDGIDDGDEIAAGMDPTCADLPWPLPDGGPYKETVDGIEWTFMVANGEASVGSGDGAAVPELTTGSIIIPSVLGGRVVTHIGDEAFVSLRGITNAILPSTMTGIGNRAFQRCYKLASINLPDGLTNIGQNAFAYCWKLTSIAIPPSVTELQNGTFAYCSGLRNVTLPDGLVRLGLHTDRYIGTEGIITVTTHSGDTMYQTTSPLNRERTPLGVFEGCTALESIALPAELKEIGVGALHGCSRLRSLDLPEALQIISYNAFGHCENLTSVTIPPLVTELPDGAFANCSKLRSIELPDGLMRLGGEGKTLVGYQTETTTCGDTTSQTVLPIYLGGGDVGVFEDCLSLESVDLPEGLARLGFRAFKRCKRIASINIPHSVMSIGSAAFAECLRLNEISLPLLSCYYDAAEKPEDGVFFGCSSLRSMTIPGTVSTLPNYMFCGCSSLKTVEFYGDNPVVDGHEVLLGTPSDLTVCVSSDTFGWYDPVTYGRLTHWQGRRVSYDGEKPLEGHRRQDVDIDIARDELYSAIWLLQELGESADDEERLGWLRWAQDIIEQYPELLNCFGDMLQSIGPSLSAEQEAEFARWSMSVVSGHLTTPGTDTNVAACAYLTITNVVVNYVLNSVQPEIAVPVSGDTGFTTIITEVKSAGAVSVPSEWKDNYPAFESKFGSNFVKALMSQTGKKDGANNDMFVWQDYVAGTDPTNPDDKFTASITMVDGVPVISYTPELSDAKKALREYKTFGKKQLQDNWTDITNFDGEAKKPYNFFMVTVEMK